MTEAERILGVPEMSEKFNSGTSKNEEEHKIEERVDKKSDLIKEQENLIETLQVNLILCSYNIKVFMF